MELFDRIITIGTMALILWLFIRNPGEFIREWIVRPFWGADVADRMAAGDAQDEERAQDVAPAHDARNARAQGVAPAHDARAQGVAPAHDTRAQSVAPAHDTRMRADDVRIDCAARALAAGLTGEAAIIELLFDGVTRGGGARYLALRDAVRERAQSYGASMPRQPRTITISGKREIEL